MANDLVIVSDFISASHFLGLLDQIFNKPIVKIDEVKDPKELEGEEAAKILEEVKKN
jgi:hypothetical protein